MNNFRIGLTGVVIAEVINSGKTVSGPVFQKNLWLNQGLDNAAAYPICQLFEYAAKGTGSTATTEDQTGSANTYSIPNNTATMTRTAGTRDFTSGDVGKLMRFTDGREVIIASYTSATVVLVSNAVTPAVTNLKATFYSVQQVGLDSETTRTNSYSSVAGENSTSTASNVRTFKRTFIFDGEDSIQEVVASANQYSQAGDTVTRTAGTRDFTAGDIGKTLTFTATNGGGVITAVGSVSSATLDTSETNPVGAITLEGDSGLEEAVTGTYSRAGATVTRATGARDFTTNDVGKIIHFATDGVESTITAFTDATHVTVNVSGTLAAQSITLYGFTDYQEFGFSHAEENGENLNIRVVLSSPVRAYISTPLRSSDQVKVTYQCALTVTPSTATAANLATVINDPSNGMSGNKNGSYVIETFATSTVAASGDTDTSLPDLEPYYDGSAGLALNADALAPLSGKVRSNSLATVDMDGEVYSPGSFTRVFTGIFGLNDAVNNNWRSLMICDPQSELAIFTFLFTATQKKDGEHTFTISFRKTWGRDLS